MMPPTLGKRVGLSFLKAKLGHAVNKLHIFQARSHLLAYDVPDLSAFFCLFPRCVPPFVSLQPALHAGPYRLHLLEWNCVMEPEHTMEARFPG